MRCRICEIPHKNTVDRLNWEETQVCRTCYCLLDFFSLNSNYLDNYWRGFV